MTQISGSNQAWNVGKVGGTCAGCGVAMEPGKSCWAALVDVKRPAGDQPKDEAAKEPQPAAPGAALPYERVDFCETCWDAGKRPDSCAGGTVGEMFSFWKTFVPTPTAKKKLLVDDSVLMDIFTRLEETGAGVPGKDGGIKEIRFRFVLALLLMRKRLLKYESTEERKEGAPEVWLMTPRGADQAVRVVNPELSAEQIGEVSGELSGILAEEV